MEKLRKKYRKRFWETHLDALRGTLTDITEIMEFKDTLFHLGFYDLYGSVVFTLCSICLKTGDFAQCDALLQEIQQVSSQDDKYPQVYFHLATGLSHWYRNMGFPAVLEQYTLAEEIVSQIEKPDFLTQFLVYHLSGTALYSDGQYVKAYQYLMQAINSFLPEELRYQKAITFNWLGIIEDKFSNTKQALYYYEKSASTWKKFEMYTFYSDTMNSIGLINLQVGKLDEAFENFTESLSIAEKYHLPYIASDAYNNLGMYYYEKKEFPQAIESYQKSLELKKDTPNSPKYAYTITNIGNVYMEMDDLDKALPYYEQSLSLQAHFTDNHFSTGLYIKIAHLYMKRQDYTNALKYAQEAEKSAQSSTDTTLLLQAYSLYTDLYKQQRLFEQALKYSLLFSDLQRESYEQRLQRSVEIAEQ